MDDTWKKCKHYVQQDDFDLYDIITCDLVALSYVHIDMMLNFLLLFLLINVTNSQEYVETKEILNAELSRFTDFFEKLNTDYVSEISSNEILSNLDDEIAEYVKNATDPILKRKRRQASTSLGTSEDIYVLDGFQDFFKLSTSNVQDVTFFSIGDGAGLIWFAAVLDLTTVSLFHFYSNTFQLLVAYPYVNGTRVIADGCNTGALLIIQNQNDAIGILRFTKSNNNYILHPIQELESYNVNHLTTWHGMNQLYLGIASSWNISIYTWLGEHFDLVQIIDLGAAKLIPFQGKEFMHLAAAGSTTTIFRFCLRSNEFVATQNIPSSRGLSVFQVNEGHLTEDFLCLSTETLTILYKRIQDRFVPFQRLPSGKSTVSLVLNKAILLLFLVEDTVMTYQYDGWRFVKLNAKLSDVRQIRRVDLPGEELLLAEYNNDVWSLEQLIWTKKKSWGGLQNEIKNWCVEAKQKGQRMPRRISELKAPVRILSGHIGQLFVRTINQSDTNKLKDMSVGYRELISKVQEQRSTINRKQRVNGLVFDSLSAKKVRVKCETMCKVNRLNIEGNINPMGKLRMTENPAGVLQFKKLRIKKTDDLMCPHLALPIENVGVAKLINGVSISDLEKNLLRVSGDQEVSGQHTFSRMNVINAFLPPTIASRSTRQDIQAKEIKVKELNLTGGGFLLPLNGSFTAITGSIKAPKVSLKGESPLQCGFTGDAFKNLSPVKLITESTAILGDYILQNITVENLLKANDLIGDDGKSMKEIFTNSISLRDNVSMSLILSSERMIWRNVNLHAHQNWITANSKDAVNIWGRKRIPRDVAVKKLTYDNLQFPRINRRLCGIIAIVPQITSTTVTIDNVIVKNLYGSKVYGNLGEKNLTLDSSISFHPLDLSFKTLYRKAYVKSISVDRVNNTDINALKKFVDLWIEPNVFKGSIEATNLMVDTLRTPIQFSVKLPQVIRNMVSKGNVRVRNIDGIPLAEFLANAVKLEDMISLGNISFSNGISSNHTHAFHIPVNLTQLGINPNLQEKRIPGKLEANMMTLPLTSVKQIANETSLSIIIQGSANFSVEPVVQNVNEINLKNNTNMIWLARNGTILYGESLSMKNASLKGNVILNSTLRALNFGTWENISRRILSKTKGQEIIVAASLNTIEVPAIGGSNHSIVKSSIPNLNDMFVNALVRDKKQVVKGTWRFDKLTVAGNLKMGQINNMNLSTDVVRHDTESNVIIGKKSILELTTKDLYDFNFAKWATNVLMQKNQRLITIKGHKTFNTVTFNDLGVFGTIMGRRIEEALSKSTDQTIYGQKTIKGSLNTSSIIIDGLINDVNLTDLINNQLKKRQSSQTISTKIELKNEIKVFGNVTIGGLYNRVKLNDFNQSYASVVPVVERFTRHLKVAETIKTALQNRAVYVNKLEVLKKEEFVNVSRKEVTVDERYQCKLKNISFLCDKASLIHRVLGSNSSSFVLIKSVALNDDMLVVVIESDVVSIYLHNETRNDLSRLTDLHVERIIDAFVEPATSSLWMALRLTSQTLVLHYEQWGGFQKFVLPETDVFAINKLPNGQLLLLLSDGVWSLEGLGSPRNIIEMSLPGEIHPLICGPHYYVKQTWKNDTIIMKARYVED